MKYTDGGSVNGPLPFQELLSIMYRIFPYMILIKNSNLETNDFDINNFR